MKIAGKFSIDNFVLALLLTIVVAYLFPGVGKFLPLKKISEIGIFGIFFFYGLKLSPSEIRKGLANWKLHILIQCTTFIIFPLLVLLFKPLITSKEGMLLWYGLYFLAALPSTVSSSVVMVSIAKGNIPGAIFNSSISGLIGILVTPLWVGLFMNTGDSSLAFGDIVLKLLWQIVLPVIIGALLHRFFGNWARKHKSQLSYFDKSIILLIVYMSFATSFNSQLFDQVQVSDLVLLLLGVVVLFLLIYGLDYKLSDMLKFSYEDKITALFCGSKKSLVHGTVFSSVLFAGIAEAGIYLLPVMIYHAFQLVFISYIAEKQRMLIAVKS